MRIWIVGKQGMLSQSFQRILSQKGIDFFATSRSEVDLTRPAAVQEHFERQPFTHIINCAAYTAVDLGEIEEEKAFLVNSRGVEILAALAKEKGKKILHFSTDYVFDGTKGSPYEEKDLCSPLSVYGKTKRLGEEKLLLIYPESCIIRTSWLFGKEGNHFVKTIIRLMREKETLNIVSDQRGRPTFSDDLVLASLELLLLDRSGLFHFANQGETSWFEWAQEVYAKLQEKNISLRCTSLVPITTKEYGAKAPRPLYSVLSTKKIEPLLSSKMRHWKESLQECMEEIL
ncbi:MAG: dTDP-4-dehydrorhamnose reductase [Simkania negevensis]|nr:dTDP-4-dehydrorhamnose reductase [Simkania negevensis]